MKYTIYLFLLLETVGISQTTEFIFEEIDITPLISGTLLIPKSSPKPPLAIIIAGSGPTNRDGNQTMMKNNSLRFLAEGLYGEGIASFRYDKRIVKQMRLGTISERDIHFTDFIDDATAILNYFNKEGRFSEVYIVGHSQGSLVGMVAAQEGTDGFISIAGAGQEIDDVVMDQIASQAPGLVDNARTAFDDIRVNGVSYNYDPNLASIFRKEIQPFMFSWMLYNPQEEIKKLEIPVLIINGDKDFQVPVKEAELLKAAKPAAEYIIIPKMNHIFKEVNDIGLENSKTYNQHDLPVMPELIDAISDFIKN